MLNHYADMKAKFMEAFTKPEEPGKRDAWQDAMYHIMPADLPLETQEQAMVIVTQVLGDVMAPLVAYMPDTTAEQMVAAARRAKEMLLELAQNEDAVMKLKDEFKKIMPSPHETRLKKSNQNPKP